MSHVLFPLDVHGGLKVSTSLLSFSTEPVAGRLSVHVTTEAALLV